jgi:hypothetical protein
MKKSALRPGLTLLLVIIASAGCIRLQNPDTGKGPLTLSEVTTASSVSPDGQPLSSAATFLASTPTIYVTAKVTNVPANTSVTARWTYVKNDAGTAVNQVLGESSATAKGTQYVSFSRQPAAGAWGSGQYSVSLLLNGKEITAATFTVQPVQQATAQAPTINFFKALPEAISTGQAVTLSWSISNASQVQISTLGSVAPQGNVIVTPVTSTEYQLTASNSAGSTGMKVNITVTSFNTDKPQLVITGFRVEGDKAYYKIKNIGGVNARQSTTFLFVQGDRRASSLVDILAAGEEREQYFPNYQWTYGAARTFKLPVRVCADGLNQIGQYDDSNKCLTLDW